MDYCRVGYSTMMQFDEAGSIIVPVTWYACAPGAKTFPGKHRFVSIHTWASHGLPTLGLGERWDAAVTYYNSAPPYYSPGTGGFCGAQDWFENGCPSDAPPIQYTDVGVPTCCPQPPCQPWYDASIFGTRRAFGTVGFPWVLDGDGFHVSVWQCHGGSDSIDFTDGGTGTCMGQPVTIAACEIESTGPYAFDLVCTDYNPVTFTGRWIPSTAPGNVSPPGFVVFFKCPPV